jgi:hypothetical protein
VRARFECHRFSPELDEPKAPQGPSDRPHLGIKAVDHTWHASRINKLFKIRVNGHATSLVTTPDTEETDGRRPRPPILFTPHHSSPISSPLLASSPSFIYPPPRHRESSVLPPVPAAASLPSLSLPALAAATIRRHRGESPTAAPLYLPSVADSAELGLGADPAGCPGPARPRLWFRAGLLARSLPLAYRSSLSRSLACFSCVAPALVLRARGGPDRLTLGGGAIAALPR